MCRFVAYRGDPIFLDELIAKPSHSLMRQSLRAEEAKTVTNGDGFGVGWYGSRAEPGVYREVLPAWSDDNLISLSASVRSHLFFAHVRAATGGGIARQNCHPFHYGRYLFMHNGQIGGYAGLRRTLESLLPDEMYVARRGATDSELLFLLAMARVAQGDSVPGAVLGVLEHTQVLMRGRGISAPLRFAAALADGERLWAFRMASDEAPPTLYQRRTGSGAVVASEPLNDGEDGWEPLSPGAVVCL